MKTLGILVGLVVLNVYDTYNGEKADFSINESALIPTIEYRINEIFLDRSQGLWLLKSDSSIVSGHISDRYPSGNLARKFSLLVGKKQGVQLTYFPNSKLKFLETFQDNKLHGQVKRWSLKDGYQLLAHLTYSKGKLHGAQRKWYSTGELHKHMNLNLGKEEGLQRAYRKNGALYANYESRNGRIFGLKRSNLCYELDNEQVLYRQ